MQISPCGEIRIPAGGGGGGLVVVTGIPKPSACTRSNCRGRGGSGITSAEKPSGARRSKQLSRQGRERDNLGRFVLRGNAQPVGVHTRPGSMPCNVSASCRAPVKRKAAIKPTVIRSRMVYTAHSKIIFHALSGGYSSIAMGDIVTGTLLFAFGLILQCAREEPFVPGF